MLHKCKTPEISNDHHRGVYREQIVGDVPVREHSGSLYDCCDTVCILVLLLRDYLVEGIAFFFAMICKMYIESIETTET